MPLSIGQISNGQPRPSVQKLTFSGSLNSARRVEAICSMVTTAIGVRLTRHRGAAA